MPVGEEIQGGVPRAVPVLVNDEWRRLGRALRAAEADGSVWPQAIGALRLLMLTGCRRQEIVTLRWDDVDRTTPELRLGRAKTGPRMVSSDAAR